MLRILTFSLCTIIATVLLTESPSASADRAKPAREASDKSKRAALPIVYSWSERTTGSANINGHEVTALDNYDPLPDVKFVFTGFKEANIVDRDINGVETTLFDCIGNPELHCAALDPRVSPDNKKIAFAVVYANQIAIGRWTIHGVMPIPVLSGTHSAQIFIYDVTTQQLTGWPLVRGVMDMHPEWINNDRLVFVSDRAKVYPLHLPGLSPTYQENYALQRWQANSDGSDAVNTAPHDDVALHPLVLSDGNIITATWRLDEELSRKVTTENQYWVTETDQFGGDETNMLGAHGTLFGQKGGRTDSLIALHFFGELSNGDIAVTNYYRGRHLGLGMPIAFPRLPHGVEGVGSGFLPAIYSILPWAQEEDNPTHRDDQGNFMGKGGYPTGLPKGRVLITRGTGYCYEGLRPEQANAEYLKGPGCDTGIYMVNKIPSSHPDDLIKIVDDPTRHEFSADVRLPYSATYGKAMPTPQQREDQGFCSLNVVNVHLSHMHEGSPACSKKGVCIKENYDMSDLRRLVIYHAHPNTKPQKTLKGIPLEGHEMTLLGYATPEADGSVNVRIPCDTPYKLRGVASDGIEFVRDQVKHSNRPGEARRCLGCHAGHTMSDYQPDVPSLFANTIAGSRPAKALEPK